MFLENNIIMFKLIPATCLKKAAVVYICFVFGFLFAWWSLSCHSWRSDELCSQTMVFGSVPQPMQ